MKVEARVIICSYCLVKLTFIHYYTGKFEMVSLNFVTLRLAFVDMNIYSVESGCRRC